MIQLALIIAAAFALQILLSMRQMRHFSDEFVRLRRKGKVACGRKSGGFHAGAIVMFQIDDAGIIQAGRKLEGVTCFARVRPLEGFEGRHIAELTEEDGPKGHRNLRRAIADASLTYRKYTAGEVIEEPPSPFRRAGRSIETIFTGKSTVRQ